jgi:hypothetical protein
VCRAAAGLVLACVQCMCTRMWHVHMHMRVHMHTHIIYRCSLNLGVLLCLECSGIHRSLGVHTSKVRSLTLDTLSGPQLLILQGLGNALSRGVWEATGAAGAPAVATTPECGRRAVREACIRAKYVERRWLLGEEDQLEQMRLERHAAKEEEEETVEGETEEEAGGGVVVVVVEVGAAVEAEAAAGGVALAATADDDAPPPPPPPPPAPRPSRAEPSGGRAELLSAWASRKAGSGRSRCSAVRPRPAAPQGTAG